MKQQIERWHEPRHANSRTPRRLVNHKSVVIESQARADVPAPQPHLVLYVQRRFNFPFLLIGKRKVQKRPGKECPRIGDPVLQRFMDRAENGVYACFPSMTPTLPGQIAAHISFPVPAVLRNNHRLGKRVRCQRCVRIAHAAGKAHEKARRNRMLKVNLPARLRVRNVLPLAGLLLHKLVGHQEAHNVVRNAQAQTVVPREISFIRSRKSPRISPVRKVGKHRGIEIAIRVKSLAAQRNPVRLLGKRNSRRGLHRRKTSSPGVEPPVPSGRNIFSGAHFHNAAQLPPIFCGKICRHHAQGFDVICIKGRSKRR